MAVECSRFQREEDVTFFERELAGFVPEKVFDSHCHLDIPASPQPLFDWGGVGVAHEDYQQLICCLLPERTVVANFIPYCPEAKWIDQSNAWAARQVAGNSRCRGEFFIKPNDDPEWVRQEVRRLGLSGLKCYHLHAPAHLAWQKDRPTWEADICDYLPESLVAVANDESLVITLHIVKSRALADRSNIHWIRHYCQTYPNMKLILAHSARGFQPQHNFEGLVELTGLDNLYFDCSANCEPMAHQAILRIIGYKKLMYGSDFPISHLRGRSVAAGDSFLWLYEQTPVWGEKHAALKPILVGLEYLRSLKWACWAEKLTESQVEDIFWNNATNLFGIT